VVSPVLVNDPAEARVKPNVVAEKEEPLVPYPVDLVVDPNVALELMDAEPT